MNDVIAHLSWCNHYMETFSALLAICAGNSPVPGEFPAQRPVTWSFDVFFDLRMNKGLSKGWWFEMQLCPFWCHCNVIIRFGCLSWLFISGHIFAFRTIVLCAILCHIVWQNSENLQYFASQTLISNEISGSCFIVLSITLYFLVSYIISS